MADKPAPRDRERIARKKTSILTELLNLLRLSPSSERTNTSSQRDSELDSIERATPWPIIDASEAAPDREACTSSSGVNVHTWSALKSGHFIERSSTALYSSYMLDFIRGRPFDQPSIRLKTHWADKFVAHHTENSCKV